ncbi:MAG: alpha-amylase family glycosyl hydrolase [Anaerolineae bacterium]
MTIPVWLNHRVFYQIFPERFANGDSSNDPVGVANWETDLPTRENTFGGDLAGIRQHIPHLKRLGVNAVYTTPIFTAGSNHKYDTWDYLTIDPAFGTLDDFRGLLAELHTQDIRLILDAVFNHCGDGFGPFRDVVERGASSRYADWFVVDEFPIRFDPPSYQTCGGAPFLPKLNTSNPEVRAYLLDIATHWMDEGIDGWRLDVPWKADMSLWPEFRQRVLARNPDAYLVSEVWRGTRDWLHGDKVHGVMNYRLRQAILDYAAFDHMDAEDFDYELHQLLAEHADTTPAHLTLLGSHDTPRIHTLSRGNVGRTRIAVTLQMTLPGTPMIYYGDEIGMEGENDPDCRRPMIWDERRWNPSIWHLTRHLIELRKAHPALHMGTIQSLRVFNGVYAFARLFEDDMILVITNPRGMQPVFRLSDDMLARSAQWVDVLSGKIYDVEQGVLQVRPLVEQSSLVLLPKE